MMRFNSVNRSNNFYILSQLSDSESDSEGSANEEESRPSSPLGTSYPKSWAAPPVYSQASTVGIDLLEKRRGVNEFSLNIDLKKRYAFVRLPIAKRSDYLDVVNLIRDVREKVESASHDAFFDLDICLNVKHCNKPVEVNINFKKNDGEYFEKHHVKTMGSYVFLCQQFSILAKKLNIKDSRLAQYLLHEKSIKGKEPRLQDLVANLRVLLYSVEATRDPGFLPEMISGLEKMASQKLTFFDLFFDRVIVEDIRLRSDQDGLRTSFLRAGIANGFELRNIFSELALSYDEIDNALERLEGNKILGKVCVNRHSEKYSYYLILSKHQREEMSFSVTEKLILASLDMLHQSMNSNVNQMKGGVPFSMVHKYAVSAITLMNQFTEKADSLSPKKSLTFLGPGVMNGKENSVCGRFVRGDREPGSLLFKSLNGKVKQVAYSAMKSPPMSLPVQSRLTILNEGTDFQFVPRYFDVKVTA